MSDVAGILLAAGLSRRYGSDKRLKALQDGTPMVLASALKLAKACPRTWVVIRPEDEILKRLLEDAGLMTVACSTASLGMGHSLACGITAAADATGWLIALADMPFIRPDTYRRVLRAMQRGALMARPTHAGRPGHPVGFAARCYSELTALAGDRGGQTILDRDPEAVALCRVDDPGVLKDIDQPHRD